MSEGNARTLTVMLVLSGLSVGSVRAEVAGAMWALRDEGRYGDKLGA